MIGHTAVVEVRGELDLATVEMLEHEIEAVLVHPVQRLILDCRRLDFMDSSGVSLLLRLHRESGRDGMALAVVAGHGAVHQVLQITGVASRLPLLDDPDELLGATG